MNFDFGAASAVLFNGGDIETVMFNGEEVWNAGGETAETSGSPLLLPNARAGKLRSFKIYGNTVQNGTPAPESPVEIKSVGDLVTDESSPEFGKYKITVKATNGTDERIANIYLFEPLRKIGDAVDYIDLASGKVVRNVKKYKFSECKAIDYYSNRAGSGWQTTAVGLNFAKKKSGGYTSLSNYFKNVGPYIAYMPTRAENGMYSDHPTLSNIYIALGGENNLYTADANPITAWENWSNAYIIAGMDSTVYEDQELSEQIYIAGGNNTVTVETEIPPSNMSAVYRVRNNG